MRQDIKSYAPSDRLKEYVMDAPEGTWIGRLDEHAWGQSQNLFLFFTDAESGQKRRLSVFSNSQYQPSKGGPAFDQEPVGGLYEIQTGKSKSGFPTFLTATRLSS